MCDDVYLKVLKHVYFINEKETLDKRAKESRKIRKVRYN